MTPHHTAPLIKLFISKLLHLFLKAQILPKPFKLTVTDKDISSLNFIYMVQWDFLTPEHSLSKHFWHSCFLPALNENKNVYSSNIFQVFAEEYITALQSRKSKKEGNQYYLNKTRWTKLRSGLFQTHQGRNVLTLKLLKSTEDQQKSCLSKCCRN